MSKPSSTSSNLSTSNLAANSNLSSSFNSGLNTFGLNNSYSASAATSTPSLTNGNAAALGGGGGGGGTNGWGGPQCELFGAISRVVFSMPLSL